MHNLWKIFCLLAVYSMSSSCDFVQFTFIKYTVIVDSLGEVEKYKKSRDWALSCREKSLQECDSIRTLGENLRRQRDRADSEKAQALRDYDNLKKQKDEAVRELKELR